MKQRFVFNHRPKRGSVGLQTHRYDPASKRTRTIYLGSVNLRMDPNSLEDLRSIEPGQTYLGFRLGRNAPLSFGPDDITRVREWLEVHGTFKELQEQKDAEVRGQLRAKQSERDALRAEVELEVMKSLAGCWMPVGGETECEEAAYAMAQAAQALELAGKQVVEAAAGARAAGHRLTNLRSQSVDPAAAANRLDELQARANRIRLATFATFTAACQEAGLMERRRQGNERS